MGCSGCPGCPHRKIRQRRCRASHRSALPPLHHMKTKYKNITHGQKSPSSKPRVKLLKKHLRSETQRPLILTPLPKLPSRFRCTLFAFLSSLNSRTRYSFVTGFGAASRLPLPPGAGDGFGGGGGGKRFGQSGQRKPCELNNNWQLAEQHIWTKKMKERHTQTRRCDSCR